VLVGGSINWEGVNKSHRGGYLEPYSSEARSKDHEAFERVTYFEVLRLFEFRSYEARYIVKLLTLATLSRLFI
jgi:hypothetical protein